MVWLTFALVLLVHLLPRLVLGRGSIITIHDGLDSDFLYRVLIAKPGRLFGYGQDVPELLGGIPRLAYPTGASISGFLFWVLPPFWAYVALEQVVHGIAFVGMYLLLRDHLREPLPLGYHLAVAATFACLPFYVVHDASVAGQAATGWALLNLWKRRRVPSSFLTLAGMPFASVFPTAGAFILALSGMGALVLCLRDRRWHWLLWGGIAVLGTMYAVSDFPFVQSIIGHTYVSHREAWLDNPERSLSFAKYLRGGAQRLVLGQYHAASTHTICLIFVVVTGGLAAARKRFRSALTMLVFVAAGAALAFSAHVNQLELFYWLRERVSLVRIVNIRFYWCAAPLWWFAFAVAIHVWLKEFGWPRWAAVFVAINLGWALYAPVQSQPELRHNYGALRAWLEGRAPESVTYEEFVAAPLFQKMKAYIGKPQDTYHVLSIGMHPAKAAFNGFYAADGYHNNYPLEYKQRFRRLIRSTLKRDAGRRRYFDYWGSRAYAFVPRVNSTVYNRPRRKKVQALRGYRLDREALHDLDVHYVFSTYKLVGGSLDRGLSFERAFRDQYLRQTFFLYSVK